MEKPTNTLITDVELNWARLVSPVNPFGTEQYELQIATTDPKKADELRSSNLTVKEKDGKFVVSLKRKAKKADGSDNGAPRVVDGQKNPIDGSKIGNGSIGNVIVWQYPYEAMGRKGIASSLTAVQVTTLVEYTSQGADFDVVEGSEEPAASAELF